MFLLYPPIDSNDIAIGVKMVDILERIDAEGNKSNPAKANLRQKEAEQSTNQPRQGTSSVIQPGLDLCMDREGRGYHHQTRHKLPNSVEQTPHPC